MKYIRREVACRYLRRYTGAAKLECVQKQGASLPEIFRNLMGYHLRDLFIPMQTRVYLKRGETRIAEITEGLPNFNARFNPATGAFRMEIPY